MKYGLKSSQSNELSPIFFSMCNDIRNRMVFHIESQNKSSNNPMKSSKFLWTNTNTFYEIPRTIIWTIPKFLWTSSWLPPRKIQVISPMVGVKEVAYRSEVAVFLEKGGDVATFHTMVMGFWRIFVTRNRWDVMIWSCFFFFFVKLLFGKTAIESIDVYRTSVLCCDRKPFSLRRAMAASLSHQRTRGELGWRLLVMGMWSRRMMKRVLHIQCIVLICYT